jgi:hypothetical protein
MSLFSDAGALMSLAVTSLASTLRAAIAQVVAGSVQADSRLAPRRSG